MIRSISDYLIDIQEQNSKAIKAVYRILEYDTEDYIKIQNLLQYNHNILQEIANSNNNISQKKEAIIKYCYREFIQLNKLMLSQSGIKKLDCLVRYCNLNKEENKDIHSKEIEPLITSLTSYQIQRQELKILLRESSLVITAVPIEFRAVIRRLMLILDVHKIPYNSTRNMILRDDEDAFEFAFDNTKDDYIHVGAEDNDPYDRPFYLIVEGVIANKNLNRKVHVVLLPNYGHIKARNAMLEVENFKGVGINYSEILIVGIAGGIDKDKVITIGDLVISKDIYGSETKKATPDIEETETNEKKEETGIDLSFRSIRRYKGNTTDLDFATWKPTIFEQPPTNKGDIQGFKSVFSQDYISIDTLSKAQWFKEKLWNEFPTCKVIEMEAFGVTSFVMEKNIAKPVIIIKSICDYGDYRKNKVWQPYCADVAASFLEDYLINKQINKTL